jgi:serine/threonine protein phosphatase PrpC
MMVANTQVKTCRDEDEMTDSSLSLLELRVGSLLDPGLKRKNRPNEDSLFVAQGIPSPASVPVEPFALFVVADGMGGHVNGQEASYLAIASLVKYVYASLCSKQITPETLLPLLMEGVHLANAMVYQRNQEHGPMMGTTMTAALICGATAYIANVGDSRTYLYRPSAGLFQITHDHSVVARLVEMGEISPNDIYTHPLRNQIYRCLGEKPAVTVDTFVVPLTAGDTLLLCSDGLWEMVHKSYIAAILSTTIADPLQAAHTLVKAALEGGGADNIAVIVVQVRKRV